MNYIVNTTFIVSPAAHAKWYEFAVEKFIPSLEEDKMIGNIRFTRLLSDKVEEHFTYSLQIDCEDIPAYNYYMNERLTEYNEFAKTYFDAEVMHFVSLLKIIKQTTKK